MVTLQFGEILREMGLEPIFQHKICPYYYDYLIDDNILIEFNDDYFPCNPRLYPEGPLHTAQYVRGAADARKKELAEKEGYTVFYVIA